MISFQEFFPVFSFLLTIIKHFRFLFIVQFIIAFLTGIYDPIRSYFFKLLFNSASQAVITDSYNNLGMAIFNFTLFYIIIISVWRLYDFITPRLRAHIKQKSASILSERLLLHSNTFYQDYLSGSLANKINDVVKGLPTIEEKMTEGLLSYLLQFSLSLYMAYQVHIVLAIIMFIWILASISFSLLVYFLH